MRNATKMYLAAAAAALLACSLAAAQGSCPEVAPSVTPANPKPSPFEMLTAEELSQVETFLIAEPTLNVTKPTGTVSDLQANYIAYIERKPPVKAEALAYLDGDAAIPPKIARVVLIMSSNTTVSEITVPLAAPEEWSVVQQYGYDVWLSRRVDDGEYAGVDAVLTKELEVLKPLIADSFGGYTYGEGCGDRCITYGDSSPVQVVPGKRDSWNYFKLDIPGLYSHPIGLEMLVDRTSQDPSEWSVAKVYYGQAVYNSTQELMTAYNDPASNITRVNWSASGWEDPLDKEEYPASLELKGPAREGSESPGPAVTEPGGRRFTVDGKQVSWMGWDFDLAMRVSGGIQLWDLNFKGERIAYEVALEEALAVYGGWTPMQARTAYLDSFWGLGSSSRQLVKGIDCPTTAEYISTDVFDKELFEYTDSICVYELDTGVPLRRHDDLTQDEYGGLRGQVLVVRAIAAVYNYDYLIDFVFHANGVMEQNFHASGYPQSQPFEHPEEDSKFGYPMNEHAGGTIHVHIIQWKVDLDIGGLKNSLLKQHVSSRRINHPYLETSMNQIYLDNEFAETEDDGSIEMDIQKPAFYKVVNEAETNKWGSARAYDIKVATPVHLVLPLDDPVWNIAPWMQYQYLFTARKEEEQHAGTIFNGGGFFDVPLDFIEEAVDGDSIRNTDLVAWVSLGNWHLPVAEDNPTTTTPGGRGSWYLKPSNFYMEDAAMDMAGNRLMRNEDGVAADVEPLYEQTTRDACTPPTPDTEWTRFAETEAETEVASEQGADSMMGSMMDTSSAEVSGRR